MINDLVSKGEDAIDIIFAMVIMPDCLASFLGVIFPESVNRQVIGNGRYRIIKFIQLDFAVFVSINCISLH